MSVKFMSVLIWNEKICSFFTSTLVTFLATSRASLALRGKEFPLFLPTTSFTSSLKVATNKISSLKSNLLHMCNVGHALMLKSCWNLSPQVQAVVRESFHGITEEGWFVHQPFLYDAINRNTWAAKHRWHQLHKRGTVSGWNRTSKKPDKNHAFDVYTLFQFRLP